MHPCPPSSSLANPSPPLPILAHLVYQNFLPTLAHPSSPLPTTAFLSPSSFAHPMYPPPPLFPYHSKFLKGCPYISTHVGLSRSVLFGSKFPASSLKVSRFFLFVCFLPQQNPNTCLSKHVLKSLLHASDGAKVPFSPLPPSLAYPSLPCPILPYLAQPYPTQPYPILPYPTLLYLTLPLLYSTLYYPPPLAGPPCSFPKLVASS